MWPSRGLCTSHRPLSLLPSQLRPLLNRKAAPVAPLSPCCSYSLPPSSLASCYGATKGGTGPMLAILGLGRMAPAGRRTSSLRLRWVTSGGTSPVGYFLIYRVYVLSSTPTRHRPG